jgi:hypothetical protein
VLKTRFKAGTGGVMTTEFIKQTCQRCKKRDLQISPLWIEFSGKNIGFITGDKVIDLCNKCYFEAKRLIETWLKEPAK